MDGKGKSVAFGEDRPVKYVKPPEWVTLIKQSFFKNGKPDPLILREQLFNEGRISLDAAKEIITLCQALLAKEPNLLRLKPSVNGNVFFFLAP